MGTDGKRLNNKGAICGFFQTYISLICQKGHTNQDSLSEFIGLLYGRYNDPISFLNLGHETVGIFETVLQVYIDRNNQQLWDLYLHFKPKKSFRDWKNYVGANSISNISLNRKYGTKNAEETSKIVNNANNILNRFKPKNKRKKVVR